VGGRFYAGVDSSTVATRLHRHRVQASSTDLTVTFAVLTNSSRRGCTCQPVGGAKIPASSSATRVAVPICAVVFTGGDTVSEYDGVPAAILAAVSFSLTGAWPAARSAGYLLRRGCVCVAFDQRLD
jgi:hypothetical protein